MRRVNHQQREILAGSRPEPCIFPSSDRQKEILAGSGPEPCIFPCLHSSVEGIKGFSSSAATSPGSGPEKDSKKAVVSCEIYVTTKQVSNLFNRRYSEDITTSELATEAYGRTMCSLARIAFGLKTYLLFPLEKGNDKRAIMQEIECTHVDDPCGHTSFLTHSLILPVEKGNDVSLLFSVLQENEEGPVTEEQKLSPRTIFWGHSYFLSLSFFLLIEMKLDECKIRDKRLYHVDDSRGWLSDLLMKTKAVLNNSWVTGCSRDTRKSLMVLVSLIRQNMEMEISISDNIITNENNNSTDGTRHTFGTLLEDVNTDRNLTEDTSDWDDTHELELQKEEAWKTKKSNFGSMNYLQEVYYCYNPVNDSRGFVGPLLIESNDVPDDLQDIVCFHALTSMCKTAQYTELSQSQLIEILKLEEKKRDEYLDVLCVYSRGFLSDDYQSELTIHLDIEQNKTVRKRFGHKNWVVSPLQISSIGSMLYLNGHSVGYDDTTTRATSGWSVDDILVGQKGSFQERSNKFHDFIPFQLATIVEWVGRSLSKDNPSPSFSITVPPLGIRKEASSTENNTVTKGAGLTGKSRSSKGNVKCYECEKKGHYRNQCPNRTLTVPPYNCGLLDVIRTQCEKCKNRLKSRRRCLKSKDIACFKCKERGHFFSQCPNRAKKIINGGCCETVLIWCPNCQTSEHLN